jgi:hypothetical protein
MRLTETCPIAIVVTLLLAVEFDHGCNSAPMEKTPTIDY